MKPVNLVPSSSSVVSVEAGKPNLQLIGGVAVGVVVVVFVAGFFAFARVDSVKSETAKYTGDAAKATAETTAAQQQIGTLGNPIEDSDKSLADGAEQVLVSAFSERHDFVLAARELNAIMSQADGGWYKNITVVAAGGSVGGDSGDLGGKTVRIEAYLPTEEAVASFNERINSSKTMSGAVTQSVKRERLLQTRTKKYGIFWHVVVTADFVDTLAPAADDAAGAAGAGDGTTVAGGDTGPLTLSLDPEPVKAKAPTKAKAVAPAKAAAPANPFDLAASAAAGGSK